jgi:CHAT domain-containing protein
LLAPVRAVIGKSVNCLLVVPTGRLIGVPFDALVEGDEPASMKFPAGRPRFVVEQLTIAYLPSVPVLLELARLPARASSYRPAVVMGGPDYSIIASGDSRSPIPPWPDLPDAREEAVDVASMLEVRADGTLRPGASERFEQLRRGRGPEAHSAWRSPDVELYVGSLVTRSEFLARAPAAKLLHIASHGFFDPQDVLESALILSAEDEQGRRLTARDILALDLAASVTVLAGCDTGRGDAGASEGMLSLAGAFIYAGSRAVVASSWSAADGATRRLSRRFYVGLIEEALGPCEALRRAKTELITTGTRGIGVSDGGASETPGLVHPRVWATFAYVGLP